MQIILRGWDRNRGNTFIADNDLAHSYHVNTYKDGSSLRRGDWSSFSGTVKSRERHRYHRWMHETRKTEKEVWIPPHVEVGFSFYAELTGDYWGRLFLSRADIALLFAAATEGDS